MLKYSFPVFIFFRIQKFRTFNQDHTSVLRFHLCFFLVLCFSSFSLTWLFRLHALFTISQLCFYSSVASVQILSSQRCSPPSQLLDAALILRDSLVPAADLRHLRLTTHPIAFYALEVIATLHTSDLLVFRCVFQEIATRAGLVLLRLFLEHHMKTRRKLNCSMSCCLIRRASLAILSAKLSSSPSAPSFAHSSAFSLPNIVILST